MTQQHNHIYDAVVIGGGAAGFFGAINIVERHRSASVLIVEKTSQVLSKVKVSGGGRCNVTHQQLPLKTFAKHYPRGERELRSLLQEFSSTDIQKWLEEKGVLLKTEADGRMFPESNTSQTIIDCFTKEIQKKNITVKTSCAVINVCKKDNLFHLTTSEGELRTKYVLACTGGSPNSNHYNWLKELSQSITPLYPSLFTFNAADHLLKNLAGVALPHCRIRIRNSKLEEEGPLLITHWGLSGPAVLKLSAWGAVELAERQYSFDALIAWDHSFTEASLKEKINALIKEQGKKKIHNTSIDPVPKRLWELLLLQSDIDEEQTWNNVSQKKMNKLIEHLMSYPLTVKGKTTFKEEFVTAGGVSLKDVHLHSMESITIPGLHFAGELLNIDGITGGFNFQAAWSTAFIAAKNIVTSLNKK
ncbi:MAG: NAD(P)/FAD-dependent oxidoreductase [Cytophagaceae bacterium]|jgi:predicted Rossmann fold flavoprotein|nr:NAD(P)/FAD-dependent oxidoreductase [Cytophagaceae bacterium]